MKKISGSLIFHSKVIPGIFLIFFLIFLFGALYTGLSVEILIILFVMFFGFVFIPNFLSYIFFSDCVDKVYDRGSMLQFHKKDKIQKVPLTEIINISLTFMQPNRVTIRTTIEGPIGRKLTFILPVRFFFFIKSAYISKLIQRVNEAKNT